MGENVRNVIIIGSGPAGYTAGLYTARAMLNPLMFAGYMSGGQLMLTSDIENFPGYPEGIGGPEMMSISCPLFERAFESSFTKIPWPPEKGALL